MTFIRRWGLFIITNLLVMVTFGIISSIVVRALNLNFLNPHLGSLMIFCLIFGMLGSFISLFISKFMAKTMYRVKIIDAQKPSPEVLEFASYDQLRNLVAKVHLMSKKAGLKVMPEVGIYDSPDVNAFATGPSKNNSLVAVSTGLLQQMSEEEIDGVLGHEVAHIANGDMVTMTLIQGIVNSFAMFFSRILASVIASGVEERNRPLVHMIATIVGDIVFTLLGSFVVAYYSRKREFRADAGSAKITSKQNMILALQRLQAIYERPARLMMTDNEEESKDALAALKISGRKKSGGILSLLSTHPPLELRIQTLQKAARL
jgi:heat shock protein HtpX